MKKYENSKKSCAVCSICMLSLLGMAFLADGSGHWQDTDAPMLSSLKIKIPYSGVVEITLGFLCFFSVIIYCSNNNANQSEETNLTQMGTADEYLEFEKGRLYTLR